MILTRFFPWSKLTGLSILVGVCLALGTGFIPNPSGIGIPELTPHGHPFPWVVINLNGPPQYEFIYLAIDSIVWGIISFILFVLISWIGTTFAPASPSVTQANYDRNVGHTQRRVIAWFFVILGVASVMKLASEFVHEVVGHGLLALLFGGRIVNVHLAWLWPYQLSSVQISGTFTEWQRLWIDSCGMLSCLITSSLCQLMLHRRMTSRRIAIPLFWLAFWTFVNPVGYLIVGGGSSLRGCGSVNCPRGP